MEQFSLELNDEMQRPVVYLENWHGLNALLDTGAIFPIWTVDEGILIELGGKSVKRDVNFAGFGGEAIGNLYQIPYITVGRLTFPRMHIIAYKLKEDVPYHIILSATMFRHLRYEIDDKKHCLNVSIPDGEGLVRNLVIEDKEGKLHVLCQSEK